MLKAGQLVYCKDFHNNNAYDWAVGRIAEDTGGNLFIKFESHIDDPNTLQKLRTGEIKSYERSDI